jgi:hypothetical protein
MNRDNPWMLEAREDLRFPNQAALQFAAAIRRVEDFESYAAIELFISRRINDTHAATSDEFKQRVSDSVQVREIADASQAVQH